MLIGVILEVGLFSCSFAARSDDRGREGVVQVIIAGVMSGLIFGAFIGILFAYFFFRPVVPRGATRRIVQKIHVAAIIGMGAVSWAQAMGGGSSGEGSPSLDIAVGWALAPGYTIGAGAAGDQTLAAIPVNTGCSPFAAGPECRRGAAAKDLAICDQIDRLLDRRRFDLGSLRLERHARFVAQR